MNEHNKKLIDGVLADSKEFNIEAIAYRIKDQYQADIERATWVALLADIRSRISAVKDKEKIREYFAIPGRRGIYSHAKKSRNPKELDAISQSLILKSRGLEKAAKKVQGLSYRFKNQYKFIGKGKDVYVGIESESKS